MLYSFNLSRSQRPTDEGTAPVGQQGSSGLLRRLSSMKPSSTMSKTTSWVALLSVEFEDNSKEPAIPQPSNSGKPRRQPQSLSSIKQQEDHRDRNDSMSVEQEDQDDEYTQS